MGWNSQWAVEIFRLALRLWPLIFGAMVSEAAEPLIPLPDSPVSLGSALQTWPHHSSETFWPPVCFLEVCFIRIWGRGLRTVPFSHPKPTAVVWAVKDILHISTLLSAVSKVPPPLYLCVSHLHCGPMCADRVVTWFWQIQCRSDPFLGLQASVSSTLLLILLYSL